MQDPEQPESSDSAPAYPDHAPLYDVEPFKPTIVERGDDSYYKPPFN